jgi:hypothetical protein
MAFHFEKPSGFEFRAGQFVNVTLVDPPETDDEGDDRTFSIASAPAEPDLIFATRMRDTAFKRVLKAAPMGSPVGITGASGRMARCRMKRLMAGTWRRRTCAIHARSAIGAHRAKAACHSPHRRFSFAGTAPFSP